MAIVTTELSKQVGWIKPGYLQYPTLQQVRTATHYQLLQWYRFLEPPATEEQREIINIIAYRVNNEHPAEMDIIEEAVLNLNTF